MLAPVGRMPSILSEIEARLLKLRQETAAQRASQLRSLWRVLANGIASGADDSVKAPEKAAACRTPRKRKVGVWLVRQVFTLIGKGYKKKDIARTLEISEATLRMIVAGTYPNLDSEAMDAWREAHRTHNAAETPRNGAKQGARADGGIGGSRPGFERSGGVLDGFGKNGAAP